MPFDGAAGLLAGCATASGFRNSIPMSRRMRIAALWTRCTPSASRGSVGRSGLTGMRQGIWSMAAVPARILLPARPPARRLRPGSSVIVALLGSRGHARHDAD